MGAVNYGTSDVITLGVKPYDLDDLDDLTHDERAAYIADDYAADYDNAAAIIDNYSFNFFQVAPAWGYYEGVYIALSNRPQGSSGYCLTLPVSASSGVPPAGAPDTAITRAP